MACTHASDTYWGVLVTPVPNGDLRAGLDPSDMMHTPLVSVSRARRRSKFQWPTLDEKAFAIVENLKHLEYLLWGQPVGSTDHLNFIFVLDTHKVVSTLSKASSQRIQNWANNSYLGTFRSCNRHIAFAETM